MSDIHGGGDSACTPLQVSLAGNYFTSLYYKISVDIDNTDVKMTTWVYSNSGCTTQLYGFDQTGAITLVGNSTSVTNGVNVTMTISDTTLYNETGGSTWKGYFDTACGPSRYGATVIGTNSTFGRMDATTCVSGINFLSIAFPANSTVTKNVFVFDVNSRVLQWNKTLSSHSNLYNFGYSSYPTTTDLTINFTRF